MAEISFDFIGAELRRLQQESRELRYAIDRYRMESTTLYETHAQHIDKALAGIETRLAARMDGFDQRFRYLDEAMGQMRQDMQEIKELILAGRPGSVPPRNGS